MLEAVLSALEAMPLSAEFLQSHPHPKQLMCARAGMLSLATRKALLRHYQACLACRETQDTIDSVVQAAIEIGRRCGEGGNAFSQADLN